MEQSHNDGGGWIVTAERIKGRPVKQHYLVAISDAKGAMLAAQRLLGNAFRVEVSGPAAAVHFRRRNVQNGEVFSLSSHSSK